MQTFLTVLAKHASLYRGLLGPQGSARVINRVQRRIAGALVGVATDWLQRDCPHTPSEMAMLTWHLLSVCGSGAYAPDTSASAGTSMNR
ncbi:hypothetical protein JOF41_000074 [Saccharothrix coeruleofusca]|uniref:TetR-like C-terminal domain-containing protein n=1 Tax=Saccharothrix coeruleofusca TaxID=33919 RepID=UPI001AEA1768|nr:TetR-like C-terminal domain-containing protein [Saccharothrix coeruleofusca]MBP2333896.1 hypothetical protein [Saccharothrix coeruleofusca]